MGEKLFTEVDQNQQRRRISATMAFEGSQVQTFRQTPFLELASKNVTPMVVPHRVPDE